LDPDLFERVRKHIKSGQWHITGGQYLQPDANLPTEAGWRRQIAYVFHRPGASQMDLPSQTFRWRGSEGGEVLGFRISPNYVTHADNLYGQIMISAEAADPDLYAGRTGTPTRASTPSTSPSAPTRTLKPGS